MFMYNYLIPLSLTFPYTRSPRHITRLTTCDNVKFNILHNDEFWLYFNKVCIHIAR